MPPQPRRAPLQEQRQRLGIESAPPSAIGSEADHPSLRAAPDAAEPAQKAIRSELKWTLRTAADGCRVTGRQRLKVNWESAQQQTETYRSIAQRQRLRPAKTEEGLRPPTVLQSA